jgi:hypothetical protein
MRTTLTIVVLALAILLPAAGPTLAQTCGNVNGSGSVDLADLSFMISYLGGTAPTPPNPTLADIDGRTGITVSDAALLMAYLMGVPYVTFNCSPYLNYGFVLSVNDTLFIPTMTGIPNGIDSVSLPVTTSFRDSAYALYFPLLPLGPGSNSVFHLSSVTVNSEDQMWAGDFEVMDTCTLIALYRPTRPSPVGRHVTFTLNYIRSTPGVGNIVPMPVNRSAQWITSFERGYDLFVPKEIYQEYTLPPETLKVAPTSLSYTAMAGKVAADSFQLVFSSTGIPITFALTPSDAWIVLKDLPATLTTPASIWVKADATALPMGSYNGTIGINPVVVGTPTATSTVGVSFTVTKPIVYPPGDFNCDGIADLADLSRFVSYLTGGGATIKDCNR